MSIPAMKPLFMTDAYKLGHIQQYALAGKVTRVYSNFTHRGSRIPGTHKVVHFGLQAVIERYLMEEWEPFFNANENLVCAAYEDRVARILGPNTIGSSHIRELHALGYLPLRICGVPEGSFVPLRIPSWTIENTDPKFAWLTNYVETVLSAAYWLAATSATTAWTYRKALKNALELSNGDPGMLAYQGHDFSFRGMSSPEAAATSGAAHLLVFDGSDSLCAIDWVERYYGPLAEIVSVPATEHSVMCCVSATRGEESAFAGLLALYPTGVLSIVSDTFDLWQVLTRFLPDLRESVLGRDGKLVIRPDSGDPEKILCGDPNATGPAQRGVVGLLWDTFGGTEHGGYKRLDPHVGVIYGDSITLERAETITENLRKQGFASTNVVFGIGSFTYQYVTRDTHGSAIKATWAEVDGVGVNLRKTPVTDNGLKFSATGRLAVTDNWELIERASPEQEAKSLLQPVWEDGEFISCESFDTIRNRVRSSE
ncbi:nicotinamide phosphoribosyltransferase [Gammaproteobacteria bacterium]